MSKSVLVSKMQAVESCLARIDSKLCGDVTRLDDLDTQEIALLNLQRAVQGAIDIAALIIREQGLKLPNSLREYFIRLGEHSVIPAELAERLAKMAGFRNIAVHEYQRLELPILKSIFAHHLGDLRRFLGLVARMLASE